MFVASSVLDVVEDSIKTVAAQRGLIGKVSNCGQPVEGMNDRLQLAAILCSVK